MPTVLLLDIDGVLVQPGGYRAALHATLNHFVNLKGLPQFEFSEEKIAELERRGITSEWDMVPLLLGVLWEDILSRQTISNLPTDVSSAAIQIGKHLNGFIPSDLAIPDFELVSGQYPADTALAAGFFSSVPERLRSNLLKGSRDVQFSETMRLFQHFTLGSRTFSKTYDLPPEVDTESLLHQYDKSNINEALRDKLNQSGIFITAFTARPSAPPREVDTPLLGYAPEAEIALELVGLTEIPLISFGKLQYLGEQRGYDPETLLKPSPVHALAGIGSALTGNEWPALQSACDWYETGEITGVLADLPQSLNVSIVEDTLGGIHSVWAAADILRKAGLKVDVHAFGLTCGSVVKSSAFEHAGVPYFEDWTTLLEQLGL